MWFTWQLRARFTCSISSSVSRGSNFFKVSAWEEARTKEVDALWRLLLLAVGLFWTMVSLT